VRAHELEREQDIEQLRRIALAQHAQIEQLIAALERKCRELETFKGSKDELQQTLALIGELVKQQQALAGKQNERAGADGGESKDDKPGDRPPKKRGTAATPQPTLRSTPLLCELPASELVCDSCGGELHKMADQFEESEMIDVVDVEYHVKQVMRQKYSCKCGGCIKTAPGPQRAIVGGRYSLDLAIKIIIDKYLYHLPLARQARIMAQHGLVISPQALWDQLYAVSQRLQITVAGLIKHVMEHPVIGLDQTSWPRLDGAGTKPWQMWCLTAPGAVVHRIRDDKSAATFKLLVGEYRGVIVCDALKTHEAGAREASHIVLAGCWAHCFRKFEEAKPDHPEATRALELIGKLYKIDRRAEGDLKKLAELRRTESTAVIDELKIWLGEQATLKTLSIGKAAGYVISNWERLTRFLTDSRIPLDNNATERGIRGPVVGRKNHYGSKSRSGTQVASTFYSLLETAKLHDVDPREYLRAAVAAADNGEVLLPWDMARPP
jgi:transposase